MNDPILITGCARSGTSIIAGIFNLSGAFGGELYGSHPANPTGMFENVQVRRLLNNHLRENGIDPRGQHPLPELKNMNYTFDFIKKWRNQIHDIFKSEGYESGAWYIKDPKMGILWPLWHAAFPSAKWIIVRRDYEDTASSCLRTGFMSAFTTHKEWVLWAKRTLNLILSMRHYGVPCDIVWPDNVVKGNQTFLRFLVQQNLLKWNQEKVDKFISPKLWKKGNLQNVN